jgi:hypothetical protein
MRTLAPFFIFPAIALLGLGCDESFSPKEEFHTQYVLQSFVEATGVQGYPVTVTALLANTYDVIGVNPATNANDPAIAGAEVTVTINQKSYHLIGAQRANPDTTRYHIKEWIYTNTIPSIPPDAAVSVIAKLPNGRTLSAQTTVPGFRNFVSNYEFPTGLTSAFSRRPGEPNWVIDWDDGNDIEVHLFVPRLTITYSKGVGADEVTGTVEVPSQYILASGGKIPVYPSPSSQEHCSFEFYALDSAMAQISAGDTNKSNYAVYKARLEVIEYDLPLSKYFSSINGSLDQYSIRTDASVYSNVDGGIGILGSYRISWVDYILDERYVHHFGYRI